MTSTKLRKPGKKPLLTHEVAIHAQKDEDQAHK